jgi:hypothetical protein
MIYRPIFWAGTHGIGEPPRYGGWGGAQADATPYGLRLAVAGRFYETGIGVLANSRLEVRNAGSPASTRWSGSTIPRAAAAIRDLHGLRGRQAARAVAADAVRAGARGAHRPDRRHQAHRDRRAVGGSRRSELSVVWGDAALTR